MAAIKAVLAGFFLFAAIHYAIQWWFSRRERVLLVFALQCAAYTVVSLTMSSRDRVTTIAEAQALVDRILLVGPIVHVFVLQFYALLARRRDVAFRVVVSCVLVGLAVLSQFIPIRGTVVALQSLELPGGGTTVIPIRTAPGVPLALLHIVVLVLQFYGLFVSRAIWKRGDRVGASLFGIGVLTAIAGVVVAVGVDFYGLRAPYPGAAPHAVFVVCMAVFLAREYSSREEREKVANRQFETAFEHAPIGNALLAADGRILRVNRAFSDMFGRSASELTRHRLQDIAELDVTGYVGETCFRRGDGQQAWALAAVSIIPDDHGMATRVVAQMQDVSELRAHRTRLEELIATRTLQLRAAKEEAERANAAKSDFLAQISHEIRTPLGAMLLYAQILQRDQTLTAAQLDKVDTIMSSGQHLMTLLGDVLEMSKIQAVRVELVEGPYDLWAVLAEIERMYSAHARSRGIELRVDRSPALPQMLFGDAGKVKQVLINLVSNAIKFTTTGAVTIVADSSDERITIRVVDTGIGIAPADLERLFMPFEQVAPAGVADGTGLGLAISRAYARLMGGDIAVESELGVGSTFSFTFVASVRDNDVVRVPSVPVVLPLAVERVGSK